MQYKKIFISALLCASVSLGACVTKKQDDIGLQSDDSTAGKSYAEKYQPARALLLSGDFSALQVLMNLNKVQANVREEDGTLVVDEDQKEKLLKSSAELALIERGLLSLNTGDYVKALFYFDLAEIKMEERDAQAKAMRNAKKAGQNLLLALTGMEETKDYPMRGYEKVMLYNYKALCYMLLGDRRAYNVTRKAIDKQQEEWEIFKAELAEIEEEINNTKDDSEDDKDKPASGSVANKFLEEDTRDEYTKKSASLVANAYVNPFGDYMDALIMEIDSYEERSIRDNARISYKKVYENNKDCIDAKTAMSQMNSAPPRGKKLVHVILADGFAPERKEHIFGLLIGNIVASAKYSVATPHESPVKSAQVAYGRSVKNMSSLSKMESIILRDDQDRRPYNALKIGLSLGRTTGVGLVANQFLGKDFGTLFSALVGKAQSSDTRSWLTLPNQVLVSRNYVNNNMKEITITTFDEKKKTMSTTTVPLNENGPTVIYAVNYNGNLHAMPSEGTWLASSK